LDLVGLVALLAGLPAMVLFVGFYAARSDWRKRPAGRALMYVELSLALAYLWIALRLGLALTGHLEVGPPQPPEAVPWQLLRVAMFGGISASQWRMLYVLLVTQRAPDRDGWTPDRPTVLESEQEG
jgi:hypothetical protein